MVFIKARRPQSKFHLILFHLDGLHHHYPCLRRSNGGMFIQLRIRKMAVILYRRSHCEAAALNNRIQQENGTINVTIKNFHEVQTSRNATNRNTDGGHMVKQFAPEIMIARIAMSKRMTHGARLPEARVYGGLEKKLLRPGGAGTSPQ